MRLTTYAAERKRKVFAVGRIRARRIRVTVFCDTCHAVIRPGTAGAPSLPDLCDDCRARVDG